MGRIILTSVKSSKELVFYINNKILTCMKKRIAKGIVALIVGVGLCSACGSNSNSKAKAQNCAVCGEQLTEETGKIKATTVNGQQVTVCSQCYAVGKMTGKVL